MKIYECSNKGKTISLGTSSVDMEKTPVFTGVVKKKKYVAQMGDGGATRRLQVSGIAVTGLVAQFYLNLDTLCLAFETVQK